MTPVMDPKSYSGEGTKKLHWTQTPEGKAKMSASLKKAYAEGKVKFGRKPGKKKEQVELSPILTELTNLIERAKVRILEIDNSIEKLSQEREQILTILK